LGSLGEDWLLHLLEQRLLHLLHAQTLLHEKSLMGHLRHQGLRHLGHQVLRVDPAHIHSLGHSAVLHLKHNVLSFKLW